MSFTYPEDFAKAADAKIAELRSDRDHYKAACIKTEGEISQTLGKALGFPWFKDDQANFPGATEENGVCTFDCIASDLAVKAADEIKRLKAEVERLRGLLTELHDRIRCHRLYGSEGELLSLDLVNEIRLNVIRPTPTPEAQV